MKDKKTLLAVLALILCVLVLIWVSLENRRLLEAKQEADKVQQQAIETLTKQLKTTSQEVIQLKSVLPLEMETETPKDGKDGKPGQDGVGKKGDKGERGERGENGKDAYQLALDKGYRGTVEEWLDSLKGENARELDIECIDNRVMKKYFGDLIWQPTNMLCEVVHD